MTHRLPALLLLLAALCGGAEAWAAGAPASVAVEVTVVDETPDRPSFFEAEEEADRPGAALGAAPSGAGAVVAPPALRGETAGPRTRPPRR